MNQPTEKRSHARCYKDTAIYYHLFNKTRMYAGIAGNYSYSGMYFESGHQVRTGTTIVIHPMTCDSSCGLEEGSSTAPFYCPCVEDLPESEECQELRTIAVAEVTRSHAIKEERKGRRYGMGVRYLSPLG